MSLCTGKEKHTKNILCTINSGCCGIDYPVVQTSEIVPETVILLGKDVDC